MRPGASKYHTERLATKRRWARAYREGRAAAVARHGHGYSDPDDASWLLCEPLETDDPDEKVVPIDRWRLTPSRHSAP